MAGSANGQGASATTLRPSFASTSRSAPPLDGGDSSGATPEDARSWIRVFTELIGIHERQLKRRGNGSSDPMLEQYQTRLEHWYGRLESMVGIDVDSDTRAIRNRDSETPLTRREFELLNCLLQSPGVPMTSTQLLGQAWQRPDLSSEQLRIYVFRLRAKLERAGVPYTLLNDRKRGYRLEHQAASAGEAG